MSKRMMLTHSGKKPIFHLQHVNPSRVNKDDVEVEVHYAGVNFADVMMSLGLYPDAPKLPEVPGYEIVGKVVNAPKNSKFKVGDNVTAFTIFGGYTDYAILKEKQIIKIPKGVDLKEAVAIPVNYTTAAVALKNMGRINQGDWVLIHGGAGGVGVMAIQIARNSGANVIATVSTEDKAKIAKKIGADFVINYQKEHFEERALEITKMQGVDIILDPIGGKILKKDFACLAPTGRVILFGLADILRNGKGSKVRLTKSFFKSLAFSPMLLMNRNAGIYGLNMLKFFGSNRETIIREHLKEGLSAIAKKQLKIIIGGEYDLEDVQRALTDLLTRKTIGKLILKCR
jgi:NADPH2:quinone reductase